MDELRSAIIKAAKHRDPVKSLAAMSATEDPLTLLRLLATLQDAQFSTAQALALGVSRYALNLLVDRGEVHRIRRGVWRSSTAPGQPDLAVTAWLACWPAGTISHASAAHAHGLGEAPEFPHVTVSHDLRRTIAGAVLHRTREMPGKDRLWIAGVAYTSVARTLCDDADATKPVATLTRVDDAIAAGAKRAWIHRRAAALAPGRSGVTLVRDATSPKAAAEFRSRLERVTSVLFSLAGIPQPAWNVPTRDRHGLIGRVDCRWDKVVAELEGLRFHTTPSQRRRDAERFNRLLHAGLIVRRFTWRDVVDRPGYVVQTIADALVSNGIPVELRPLPDDLEIAAVLVAGA